MQMEEYPVPNECARAQVYLLLPVPAVDDPRLNDGAVLLLAEIMALANNTGYCYASNAYLRQKRRVSQSTLTNQLGMLKQCGYVKVEIIKNADGSVKERRIYPYCLDFTPYTEKPGEVCQNLGIPPAVNLALPLPENWQENNISMNNISKNNRERVRESRPESVEAVRAYCQERNNGVDPEAFWDYYEANGWKQGGKAPIKDWKACVRTWERKNGRGPRPKGGTATNASKFAEDFV